MVKQLDFQHILLVRTDRIGDVLLTLPMIPVLKSHYADAKISMLVSDYTCDLISGIKGIAEVLRYTRNGKPRPFFEILNMLRNYRFDAAVAVYPRFRIALLLWLARIPIRIGTGYRWYSFLFNRRVYEHRKTVAKHEAEYNIALLRPIGCSTQTVPYISIDLSEQERQAADGWCNDHGIQKDKPLVVLHPGSGGSAHSWAVKHFAELATALCHRSIQVVLAGGKEENELITSLAKQSHPEVKTLTGGLSIRQYAALMEKSKVFVANSTGPLHLAANVGTAVVGLYSPVVVMSPKRWGPLTEKKVIFVPDPEKCVRCKGGKCRANDCMEQITVEEVVEAVMKFIV